MGVKIDKNNSFGFTLIEIIAIIVLLSVIALLTYPIINNVIDDSKEELYIKQINELERLSNTWVTNNISKLKIEEGYIYNLSFEELYEQGLITEEDIKNPKTDELLDGCVVVTYNSNNNGYDVAYDSSCTTTGEVILYKDNSGANRPKLFNNMVPIKYKNNKWVVANTSEKWYDYDAKEWANAVVLNSGVTKNVGDEVTEEEISLWYVWVPRYKYTIFNGNNGSVSEQLIDVTFENDTERTGTVSCYDNFDEENRSEICGDRVYGSVKNNKSTYTHPAFKFGNTELTGFWVGKFEVSGSTSAITIQPNVPSLRSETVSSFFTAIQNVKTTYGINNADSHMM